MDGREKIILNIIHKQHMLHANRAHIFSLFLLILPLKREILIIIYLRRMEIGVRIARTFVLHARALSLYYIRYFHSDWRLRLRWCNHGTLAMAFHLQIFAARWHLTALINVEPNYLIAGAHRVDGCLHANSTNSYIFRTTSRRENIFIFDKVNACAIILMLLYVCLLHLFHLVVTITSILFFFRSPNFIFKELLRNVHFGK